MLKRLAKYCIALLWHYSGVIRRKKSAGGLLILMFHKVNNGEDPLSLTVSEGLFESVVREVKKDNQVIRVSEIGSCLKASGKGLKTAITFDDGYRDNYQVAFPILKKHNTSAMIYLSTDFIYGLRQFWYEKIAFAISNCSAAFLDTGIEGIGAIPMATQTQKERGLQWVNSALKAFSANAREEIAEEILSRSGLKEQFMASEMLNWDEVRAMKDNGIEMGSHTVSHPILSKETRETIERELTQSKEIIEQETGDEVASFAYPNGTEADFNDGVVEAVEKAGYQTACTTIEGINQASTPLHLLKRINVSKEMCTFPPGRFSAKLFWFNVVRRA